MIDRKKVGQVLSKVASIEKVAANWSPTGMTAPVPKTGLPARTGRRGMQWVKDNPNKALDRGLDALTVIPAFRGARFLGRGLRLGWKALTKKVGRDVYKRQAKKAVGKANPFNASSGTLGAGKPVPGNFRNLSFPRKTLRVPSTMLGVGFAAGSAKNLYNAATLPKKDLRAKQVAKIQDVPTVGNRDWKKSPRNVAGSAPTPTRSYLN
jgi:hypothetical protein